MSDDKEMTEAMEDLLRAESGFSSKSFNDGDEETNTALVEEQLLSFYSKQLEHPPQKRRSTLKKTEPPLPIHKPHAYPCRDTHLRLPCNPQKWPQRPVRGCRTQCMFVLYEYNKYMGFTLKATCTFCFPILGHVEAITKYFYDNSWHSKS
jgi:hypothetical protein